VSTAGPVRVADASLASSTVWADRRLGAYVVLTAVGLVLALVTGDTAYVAAAAPGAVLLAWSARGGRAPGVAVTVREPPARVLEGDRWHLELRLAWAGPVIVDLVHHRITGHEHDHDGGAVRLAGTGGATVRIPLRATRWGRHGVGRVSLRLRRL
jgi:uncharacterized protein (DUF58 family)